MRRIISVTLAAVVLVGCSSRDDANKMMIMEQQRINLDTLKQNQEALDKIRQKEKEIALAEKKNEDAVRDIEARKKELTEYEAKLKKYGDRIEALKKDGDDVFAKNEALREKIMTANATAAKMAELAQRRIPFAERLAVKASSYLSTAYPPHIAAPPARSAWGPDANPYTKHPEEETAWRATKEYHYKQCIKLIQDSGVMAIESDDVFEAKARDVMGRYLERYIEPAVRIESQPYGRLV